MTDTQRAISKRVACFQSRHWVGEIRLRTGDNLKLEGKLRQDALPKRIDKSEDPDANMGERDEQWRIEVRVERRLKIAGKAASRYFEQRTLSEEC